MKLVNFGRENFPLGKVLTQILVDVSYAFTVEFNMNKSDKYGTFLLHK